MKTSENSSRDATMTSQKYSRLASSLHDSQSNEPVTFRFLNFDNPAQAKSARFRKTIRSHVTRRQHQTQRAIDARNLTTPTAKTDSTKDEEKDGSPLPELDIDSVQHLQIERSDSSASSISFLKPHFELEGIFPTRLHAYVQRAVQFYHEVMTPDVDYLNANSPENLIRSTLIPFLLSDPVSLQSLVLFIAPYYSQACSEAIEPVTTVDILLMRGLTIRAINSVLANSDAARRLSDHVIIAISVLGYYEFVIGEPETCQKHRGAVARMVNLRGGLDTMGLNGLLGRLLIWTDLHMSCLSETMPYFYKSSTSRKSTPLPTLDRDLFFKPLNTQ